MVNATASEHVTAKIASNPGYSSGVSVAGGDVVTTGPGTVIGEGTGPTLQISQSHPGDPYPH